MNSTGNFTQYSVVAYVEKNLKNRVACSVTSVMFNSLRPYGP